MFSVVPRMQVTWMEQTPVVRDLPDSFEALVCLGCVAGRVKLWLPAFLESRFAAGQGPLEASSVALKLGSGWEACDLCCLRVADDVDSFPESDAREWRVSYFSFH